MSNCPHDFTERETAVTADGYCPLCMATENTELLAALRRIAALEDEDIFDADKIARNAIAKAEGGK
jgi:hypothetical protein